jgi:hypothetical protein
MNPHRVLLRFRNGAAVVLVWAGVLACTAGLLAYGMWTVLPWRRFADSVLLALISIALAWPLRRWHGASWAAALAAVWLAALVFFVGVMPVGAVVLIAGAAIALGSLLVPQVGALRAVLALAVGLALLAGALGWLLPLPIHRWFVYLPLLFGLCALRAGALRAMVCDGARALRGAAADAPGHAAATVLVLGLASIGAWLPTMQADDLAYHLGLPTQLQLHGFYALDPAAQIWALAPWLGDVLQGLAQVLAGREARGAVDTLWMLSAAAALFCLAGTLGAAARVRWLAVALFASLPLLAVLLGGMQTELAASALALTLALAIALPTRHRLMLACAVLAAALVALKLGHAVTALVLLVWALMRVRGAAEWSRLPLALLLFCGVAGSSYFYAWKVSGNPLLPLFNEIFQSPLLPPTQLRDPRWHAGFGIDLPWSITFTTDRYLEAWAGGFGFVLVACAGAWLLALTDVRTRGLALVASAALLLPLLPMQYARYAFPGLVLLLPALLVAMTSALGVRWCTRIVIGLCALNLAFQANAGWLLHVNALRKLVTSGGNAGAIEARYAPERALIAELRRRDPGDSVVFAIDPRSPDIAELGGRGRSVAWYAPTLERARISADADASGERWRQLMTGLDARWLLLRPQHLSAAQRAGLALAGAVCVDTIGDAQLWSLPGTAKQPPLESR